MNPKYLKAGDGDPVDTQGYLHLTGQLNWVATKTRPDIVYAVGRLQKKNTSPTTTDMAAGKDLLSPPVSERDGVCLGTRPHKGCDLYTTDNKKPELHNIGCTSRRN